MKRILTLSAFMLLVLTSAVSFALDRTNTAQKGSLLMFPLIDVSPGKDTLVRIENHNTESVNVRCTWQNGTAHTLNLQVNVAASSPQVMIASETFPTDIGPGDPAAPTDRGELKCWAMSNDGQSEIRWNHLAGSATVLDFDNSTSKKYTAWAFRCIAQASKGKGKGKNNQNSGDSDGNPCGETPGVLLLDGSEYETCPSRLGIGFSPAGAFGGLFGDSVLAVATCNQDFRLGGELSYTQLQFATWRESDGTNFSGGSSCIDNWHETTLEGIQVNPQIFSLALLGNNGRFEVEGAQSNDCPNPASAAGLVGVISTSSIGDTATTLVGIGESSGAIHYDTSPPVLLLAPASAPAILHGAP